MQLWNKFLFSFKIADNSQLQEHLKDITFWTKHDIFEQVGK